MHWQGVLIALEGIDGSGLTTHSKLLVEALNRLGYRAVYTKEPTRGPIGLLIRDMLKSKPDPGVLALLFAADRLWHLKSDPGLPGGGILGALNEGYIVVTDRYKYSSIAYQGRDLGYEWVSEINKHAPDPHILVYIRVDPLIAWERIRERAGLEFYENPERLKAHSEALDRVIGEARASGVRVLVIDQTPGGRILSIEETHKIILERVLEELKNIKPSQSKSNQ